MTTIVLSAGGTGGHLFPAQALAQEHDGNIKRFQAAIAAKDLEIDAFNKEAREVLLDVFRDAAEFWGERKVQFRVFYSFA